MTELTRSFDTTSSDPATAALATMTASRDWSRPVELSAIAHQSAVRCLERAEAVLELVELGGYNSSAAAMKDVMQMVWALVQDARFELTGKPQSDEDRPSYLPRRAS